MKIAIASGKGGTGKTFVSTNLFRIAEKKGIPATIIDCDAEEPNVREFIEAEEIRQDNVFQHIPVIDSSKCTLCGKCHEYCNYNAIVFLPAKGFIKVMEELCHDCGACLVACQHGAISEKQKHIGTIKTLRREKNSSVIEACSEVGVFSPVPLIRKAIAETKDTNQLILLDSPPGISCPFIATVDSADLVILVTEPTPFGLNDLKLSVETLQEINKPFGVVVNRADLGNNEVHLWLKEKQIPLLLEIPFDREIARIYSTGNLLVDENELYAALFEQLLNSVKQLIA